MNRHNLLASLLLTLLILTLSCSSKPQYNSTFIGPPADSAVARPGKEMNLLAQSVFLITSFTDTSATPTALKGIYRLYSGSYDLHCEYEILDQIAFIDAQVGNYPSGFDYYVRAAHLTAATNPDFSKRNLAKAARLLTFLPEEYRYRYLNEELNQTFFTDSLPAIRAALATVEREVPLHARNPAYMITAYSLTDQSHLADRIVASNPLPADTLERLRYLAALPIYYYAKGDYLNAYHSLLNHDIYDFCYHAMSLDIDRLYHNERISTSRQLAKRKARIEQQGHRIWLIISVAAALALVLTFVVRRSVKLRRLNIRLRTQLEKSADEAETLTKLIDDLRQQPQAPASGLEPLLRERLELINRFIVSTASGQKAMREEAEKSLAELANDKARFVDSTVSTFDHLYPRFMGHLRSNDLTPDEVAYCVFYALGLRGKEVNDMLNAPRVYNTSVVIKRKLGLDGQGYLGPHIRRLFTDLAG